MRPLPRLLGLTHYECIRAHGYSTSPLEPSLPNRTPLDNHDHYSAASLHIDRHITTAENFHLVTLSPKYTKAFVGSHVQASIVIACSPGISNAFSCL
jgi:hypothetical protein